MAVSAACERRPLPSKSKAAKASLIHSSHRGDSCAPQAPVSNRAASEGRASNREWKCVLVMGSKNAAWSVGPRIDRDMGEALSMRAAIQTGSSWRRGGRAPAPRASPRAPQSSHRTLCLPPAPPPAAPTAGPPPWRSGQSPPTAAPAKQARGLRAHSYTLPLNPLQKPLHFRGAQAELLESERLQCTCRCRGL